MGCCRSSPRRHSAMDNPSFAITSENEEKPERAVLRARLLDAFHYRNIAAFHEALNRGADPDTRCPDTGVTCLALASMEADRESYVRALLDAGADPNKDMPLILAAHRDNYIVLQSLLSDTRTNVNALFQDKGNILHYLCWVQCKLGNVEKLLRCLSLALDRQEIQVNKRDAMYRTPIMYAVEMYYEDRVFLLLTHAKHRVHLDEVHPGSGKTVREFILKRFGEFKCYLHDPVLECMENKDPHMQLLAALQHRRLDKFREILQWTDPDGKKVINPNHWYSDPYHSTCLELACRQQGSEEYVKSLLQAGADPRLQNQMYGTSILYYVVDGCSYDTLKILLEDGRVDVAKIDFLNMTPLHCAVMQRRVELCDIQNAQKCIQLLLDAQNGGKKKSDCHVNAQDDTGNTALHYAASFGNKETVLTLLRNGASLMIKNKNFEPALSTVSPEVLKTFLDDHVYSNGYSSRNGDYTIIFNYDFLISSENSSIGEMEPLIYMSEPHLRHLLQHPVINSFLSLKWNRVQFLFYLNVLIYTIFVLTLSVFVYFSQSRRILKLNSGSCFVAPPGLEDRVWNVTMPMNETVDSYSEYVYQRIKPFMYFWVAVLGVVKLVGVFILREHFFRRRTSVMSLAVMLLSLCITLDHHIDEHSRQHIAAVLVLFSWGNLIMLTGSLPMHSLQLEMIKKVSKTFLRFMAWYSLILIAFALSFYTLFHNISECTQEVQYFFSSPWLTILKTVTMMTGELTTSSLPYDITPGTSHAIFILFVFIVTVVLLNLLYGLAVNDAQSIRENARVLSLVSLVRLVASVEKLLLDLRASRLLHYFKLGKLFPDTRLYSYSKSCHKKQLLVFPNACGKVRFYMDYYNTKRFSNFKMDKSIIKAATELIANREDIPEVDQVKYLLEHSTKLICSMRDEHKMIINQLNELGTALTKK